jgi:hypothetical protein
MTGPEIIGRRPALSEGEPVMHHLPLGPKGLSDRWRPIGAPDLVGVRPGRRQKHVGGGKNGRPRSSRSKRR